MAKIETIFPLTTRRNEAGGLMLAGVALADLAERFGTPVYVYDAETIRTQVKTLRGLLAELYPAEAEIAYAAKAYFSLAMARKLAALGLSVDVVSLGELVTAARAGFGEDRVHLHGNNKSPEELAYAIVHDLQAVVVDSLEELEYLDALAQGANQPVRIWLRITPGLSVDTHPYRQTGHASSKFGFPIPDGQAEEAIRRALASPWLRLTGLHMHLGSQIFETEPFAKAIQVLLDLAERCNYVPEELSPGGGWGVAYTTEDEEANPRAWVETVCRIVRDEYEQRGWKLPKLVIEPGRWLVARAGMALYRVGTHKTASDGSKVVAVDGGMADNPRPALYHAQYTACLANRQGSGELYEMRIVGKFCESGDELIHAAQLPELKRGDLLAVPVAGAYQLSMASNYNLAPRPAVLWLEDGQVKVLQKRETLEDGWWWEG
jgi:diaminopimelate decarboxylase